MAEGVEFGLLGPLTVRIGSVDAAIDAPKQRCLLAALLTCPNQVVSTDTLLEQMWGAEHPSAGLKALRFHVSKLRSALRLASPVLADRISTRAPGYCIEVADAELDSLRFEKHLRVARQVRALAPDEAMRLFDEALAEFLGPPLEEFVTFEFAQATIRRLERLQLEAIAEKTELFVAHGRGPEVLADLEGLVSSHPLHEGLCGSLMSALHQAGRTTDALAAFQRARHNLAEAGMLPTTALSSVEGRILANDPELTPTSGHRSPSRMPVPVTDIIGRDADLALVEAALGARRLVTLQGIGGVGKTSLALHACQRVVDHFERMGWVDLSEVTDPGRVPGRIALALGMADQLGLSALESLTLQIRDRAMLVVLDNCEHLVPDVAIAVETLLNACPELRVLATSRHRLDVVGERVASIEPLAVAVLPGSTALPAAVELFIARARDRIPRFEPSIDELKSISELCAMLDGLPLGIELAAARMNIATPSELLAATRERSERRLRASGVAEALGALEDVVGWSYERLAEADRLVLDRIGVFAGRFDLRAVAEVCAGDDVDVVECMSGLVSSSLVTRSAERTTMFSLLETVRTWSRARLAERGDIALTADRHATFVLHRLRELQTSSRGVIEFVHLAADVDVAFDLLERNDDVEAMAELLTAAFSSWSWAGKARTAYSRFELLAPHLDRLSAKLRATMLLGLASLQTDVTVAQELLTAAIAGFAEAGDCAHQAYNNFGGFRAAQGDMEGSIGMFESAIREIERYRCPESGGTPWIPRGNMAVTLIELGRLDEARIELAQAAEDAEDAGWGAMGITDIGYARLAALDGDHRAAAEILSRRVEILEHAELQSSYGMAWVLSDLASEELHIGATAAARGHICRALEVFGGLFSVDDEYDALVVALRIAEREGDFETAAFLAGGVSSWINAQRLVLRDVAMRAIERSAAESRSGLAPAVFELHWLSGAGRRPHELNAAAVLALSPRATSCT